MAAAGLEAEGLSAGYGGARILDAVSFSVPAASRLAVLGRNGTGKTTLFATLMGQTRRHAGRIVVGGRDVTSLGSAARARAGLGYVPQTRNIFRSLTVEENLIVGLKGRSRSTLAEAYAMFPRLFERRRHRGDRLSGGEQQMLSTARTLLGRPSVLLLDEPLEGLAPIICEELMAALTRQAEAGTMTIALVEQKLESALDFADSVLILERGRIAWAGSARQLRAEHHVIERLLAVGAFAEER